MDSKSLYLLSNCPYPESWRLADAERAYHERSREYPDCGDHVKAKGCSSSELVGEIARARQHIQQSLNGKTSDLPSAGDVLNRIEKLETENVKIKNEMEELGKLVKKLESQIAVQVPPSSEQNAEDDFELFGEDEEESEDVVKMKEERIAAYQARKSNKPALIAKSSIILDVKPWDDETDMKQLEQCVRSVTMDGLLWGASKFVPLAFGIKKLQITCVVEDDKVSTDDLEEKILAFEDCIQSMDIAAFNKV